MVHVRDDRLSEESEATLAGRSHAARKGAGAKVKAAGTAPDVDPIDQEDRGGEDELEGMNDDERFDFFVQSYDNSVLPDLPPMPGFHVCWLTTTNPRDPVARRIRMGYQPIRADDLGPGWSDTGLKTGEYSGVVAINEMIAAKIPMKLYQRYMAELHHTRPLSDEEKLRANLDLAKDRAKAMGGNLMEGDGMTELVQRAPMPTFVG